MGYDPYSDTTYNDQDIYAYNYTTGQPDDPFSGIDPGQNADAPQLPTGFDQNAFNKSLTDMWDAWAKQYAPTDTQPSDQGPDFTIPTGEELYQQVTGSPEFQQMQGWFQGSGQAWTEMDTQQQDASFNDVWFNQMTQVERDEVSNWYNQNYEKYMDTQTGKFTNMEGLTKAYNEVKNKYMLKYGQAGGGQGGPAGLWGQIAGIAGQVGQPNKYMQNTQAIVDYLSGGDGGGVTDGLKPLPTNFTVNQNNQVIDIDTGQTMGDRSEFAKTSGPGANIAAGTGNYIQDSLRNIQDLATKAGMPMDEIKDLNTLADKLLTSPEGMMKLSDIAIKLEGGTATNQDMQELQTMITDLGAAGEEAIGNMTQVAQGLENSTPALEDLAKQIDALGTAGMDSQEAQAKIADLLAGQGTEELAVLKDLIAGLSDIGIKEGEELTGLAKTLMNLPSDTIESLKKLANEVANANPDTEVGQKKIAEVLANIQDAQALQKQRGVAEGMAGLTGA
ncbi:hypothetical protein LCGC14_1540680, partial [marine sediment metagenome]